jgi:hypothetical protein
MSWDWVALAGVSIIVILLIIFRKTTFVKKNWKYAVILAPLAFLLILKIISGNKKDDTQSSSGEKSNDDNLEKNMENLKDRLGEVQMETAIEVSAAKTKNEDTLKQLEEIKQIEDKSERRERLAAMIG